MTFGWWPLGARGLFPPPEFGVRGLFCPRCAPPSSSRDFEDVAPDSFNLGVENMLTSERSSSASRDRCSLEDENVLSTPWTLEGLHGCSLPSFVDHMPCDRRRNISKRCIFIFPRQMVEPGTDTETDVADFLHRNREHHAQRRNFPKVTKGWKSNLSGAVLDDILWR